MRIATRIVEELANAAGPSCLAKTIYIVTMFGEPQSVASLADKVRINERYVATRCRELERLGWLRLVEDGRRLRPEAIVPREVEALLASEARSLVAISPYRGECLTTVFVEWVASPTVQLIYNARPDFLRNEDTGSNLEYDIFAPEYSWAKEYHGDQHFGTTSRYPSEKAFIERIKRDRLKIRLSKEHRIRLSVVTNQDLTLKGILEAIPQDVPRRAFDSTGPMIQTLEQIGKEVAGNQSWDRE